jgi:hypothetical protein
MNNTRRKNEPPLYDIANDDFMVSNQFVRGTDVQDISLYDKNNFREFHDLKKQPEEDKIPLENTMYEVETVISIDTEDRDKDAYPEPNDMIIPFGKSFYNVKKIKLISMEFPNTDQVIRDTPVELKNNTITWQNEEDNDLGMVQMNMFFGNEEYLFMTSKPNTVRISLKYYDPSKYTRIEPYFIFVRECSFISFIGNRRAYVINGILEIPFEGGITGTDFFVSFIDFGAPNYTVNLKPGNYDIISLAKEFEKKMNLVKRRDFIDQDTFFTNLPSFHFFKVDVDISTDIITFNSYKQRQLEDESFIVSLGEGTVEVFLPSHGLKPGDQILISGAKGIGGLPSSTVNGLFTVNVPNNPSGDVDFFSFKTNGRASRFEIGGGSEAKIGIADKFKILYFSSGSQIADNMGFPYEDSSDVLESTISTRTFSITGADIIGGYIRFTTTEEHQLNSAQVIEISSISTSGKVITAVPHGIIAETNVDITDTNSFPPLNGNYPIIVTGNNTFNLLNINLSTPSTSGYVKHSGDKVSLINFKSSPQLSGRVVVENTTDFTFDIQYSVSYIDPLSFKDTVIGISQITVVHPKHGFSDIISIIDYSGEYALISTKQEHNLKGTIFDGVELIRTIGGQEQFLAVVTLSFPYSTQGIIETGDIITILGGGFAPFKSYIAEYIDLFTVRFRTFNSEYLNMGSICSVHIGDRTVFNDTNSVPQLYVNPHGAESFFEDFLLRVANVLFESDGAVIYFSDFQFLACINGDITTAGTSGIVGKDRKIFIDRIPAQEPRGPVLGGIPMNVLNKKYHNIEKIIDENTYIIDLKYIFATETASSSGKIALSSWKHGFKNSHSNTFNGNRDGILYKSISLEGENYVFLTSPNLNTLYTIGGANLGDIFAKILLLEPPGVMMFDNFISAPKEFNPPVASIDKFQFQVRRGDGFLYNFNDIDFSFSISITESVDKIKNTYISSHTGN